MINSFDAGWISSVVLIVLALLELQKAIGSHLSTVGTNNPIVDFDSSEALDCEDIEVVPAVAILTMNEKLESSEH